MHENNLSGRTVFFSTLELEREPELPSRWPATRAYIQIYFISQKLRMFYSLPIKSRYAKIFLQKLRTPWKEILTSLPMWALIIVHCGQNWGFWLLLTEIPTYMSEVLGYDIKDVSITIKFSQNILKCKNLN